MLAHCASISISAVQCKCLSYAELPALAKPPLLPELISVVATELAQLEVHSSLAMAR